jgi:hypothetical protein
MFEQKYVRTKICSNKNMLEQKVGRTAAVASSCEAGSRLRMMSVHLHYSFFVWWPQ